MHRILLDFLYCKREKIMSFQTQILQEFDHIITNTPNSIRIRYILRRTWTCLLKFEAAASFRFCCMEGAMKLLGVGRRQGSSLQKAGCRCVRSLFFQLLFFSFLFFSILKLREKRKARIGQIIWFHGEGSWRIWAHCINTPPTTYYYKNHVWVEIKSWKLSNTIILSL